MLHVLSSLERGGIDLWLMQILRRIDRDRYQMDFMVLNEREGVFGQEAQSLGSHIMRSPQRRKPWRLREDFAHALRRYGPYDVIHGHVHHFNGLMLRLAAWHGVPIRIAHSHSDTRTAEAGAAWRRRLYLMAMKRWIRQYATHRIAVSRSAAEDLFGADWSGDLRCKIIPCGIDLTEFVGGDVVRAESRKALGLRNDALVIGHVGRFLWAKNHPFLLAVAAALFRREPRARLLLVGNGRDEGAIRALARTLGIADRVIFTGARADVPRLLKGAMDAFVFPSRYEGLGMAVIEAQAAGLPCIIAAGIPEEIEVVPQLIRRVSLSASAEVWAERILEAIAAPRPSPEQALQAVCASDFDIQRSAARLLDIYGMNETLRAEGTYVP